MMTSLQLFLFIWGVFVAAGAVFTALAWLVYLGYTHLFPVKPEPQYHYDAWKNWDPWTDR